MTCVCWLAADQQAPSTWSSRSWANEALDYCRQAPALARATSRTHTGEAWPVDTELVDEYDKPILEALDDPERAKAVAWRPLRRPDPLPLDKPRAQAQNGPDFQPSRSTNPLGVDAPTAYTRWRLGGSTRGGGRPEDQRRDRRDPRMNSWTLRKKDPKDRHLEVTDQGTFRVADLDAFMTSEGVQEIIEKVDSRFNGSQERGPGDARANQPHKARTP